MKTQLPAKYTLLLSSVGNPDFRQDPTRSLPGVRKKTVKVHTLREASELCRAYIQEHSLGMGNWSGGQVFEGTRQVAQISYNGRAWAAGNDRKELPLEVNS